MNYRCPLCNGAKTQLAMFPRYVHGYTGERKACIEMPCSLCQGSGTIQEEQLRWYEDGRLMRAERINRGVGLRQEAEIRGMLPSELSNMEQGRIKPVWRDDSLQPPSQSMKQRKDGEG